MKNGMDKNRYRSHYLTIILEKIREIKLKFLLFNTSSEKPAYLCVQCVNDVQIKFYVLWKRNLNFMHIRRCWLTYAKFYWEEAEYIFPLISLIICYMIKCPSMFFVKLSFLKKWVEINHSDMRGLGLSENLYFFFAREVNFQYFFTIQNVIWGVL